MKLGIVANTGKSGAIDALTPFLDWLQTRGTDFLASLELKPLLPERFKSRCDEAATSGAVDFVLSFGGDGTFLETARRVAPTETPILGVNFGGFGYLAEVGIDQLQARVVDLENGRFTKRGRSMLEVTSYQLGEPFCALNDVVIDKGAFTRTIRLTTSIDGEYVNTFTADGLIVATPTGSTGYALSAGGPILEPPVRGIIINPICPHTLANRPLVVGEERAIGVMTESQLGQYQLSVDGRMIAELPSPSAVTITRAKYRTFTVEFTGSSFFALLRTKLKWRDKYED